MSDRRPLWLIITPVYRPAPGGGAIYTDTLGRALAADGANVVVATEAFPGEPAVQRIESPAGSLVIRRLFPCRAGRAEIDWRTYRDYARQNAMMLGLPAMLARAAAEHGAHDATVLIHSSFFYKPSVMPLILGRLRGALPGRVRLVADVRDPLLKNSLFRTLSRFDDVVGCSLAIADRLRGGLPGTVQVHHIPIPFAPAPLPSEAEVEAVLAEYDLAGVPFVLNPNGITERKAYPLMLDVVRALRRMPGHERTVLVTVGRARDWSERDDKAAAAGILRYLGPVPTAKMLALAKAAKAALILSEVEGLPRSALELLALQTPLILPDLAELRESVSAAVAVSREPELLAQQICTVSDPGHVQAYPLDRHAMATLLPSYRALEQSDRQRMTA
jgi:glycosyltransferase involved in cell wall biosynthesis